MYPNPQEALPLPPHPSLEQYNTEAKALVEACRSGDPNAIRAWAASWLDGFATLYPEADESRTRSWLEDHAERLEQYAKAAVRQSDRPDVDCALSDAQLVIARAHGFLSWPAFTGHIESLADPRSDVFAFEAAADAIVTGDADTLERLLGENPGLVRTRSTREHAATLLHYVSANGVEGHRQESPKNAAGIAHMLLEAGAEVDAEANVYGGGCTTLGLVATSAPPAIAGVQRDVIDVLLKYGARMDLPGSVGNRHALVRGCLANGQPEAAEYLVGGGAPLDLPGAAGLGRLDVVSTFFKNDGSLTTDATHLVDGFALACAYGRADVVEFLLQRGMEVDAQLRGHGEGHTGLHSAAFHGHVDVVKALLRRGARVDVIDKTWGTPPLLWALTGWCEEPASEGGRYYEVVALLVAAGAVVKPELLDWDKARADPKMLAALTGQLRLS